MTKIILNGIFQGILIFLLAVCVFKLLSSLVDMGENRGINKTRFQAIQAGVGEFYLDEKNEKQFRFKQPVKEQVKEQTL